MNKIKLLPSYSLYSKEKRSPNFKQENPTILENKCYKENKMLQRVTKGSSRAQLVTVVRTDLSEVATFELQLEG